MAQTKKKQIGKKKPIRTTKHAAQKSVARRPGKPKQMPNKRTAPKTVPRRRAPVTDQSLEVVATQLQRIEKQVALLQTELAESRKAKPVDVDVRMKTMERKFGSRLGRLDERIDSLRAHLLDLEERLEGETNGGSLHTRDLDEGMDDS
jgi:hypothetical protein